MFSVLFVIASFAVSASANALGPGGLCSADDAAFEATAAFTNEMGGKGLPADKFKLWVSEAERGSWANVTSLKFRITGGSYTGHLIKATAGVFSDENMAVRSQNSGCSTEMTAATHSNADAVLDTYEYTWTPPAAGTGEVKVQALVVTSSPKGTYQTAEITMPEVWWKPDTPADDGSGASKLGFGIASFLALALLA